MATSSSLPLTVSVIQALDIGKQSRAGALGILIYDHFLTIGMEVDYVWSQKWGLGQFLYIFNGWLALLWLCFDSIPLTPSGVVSSKMWVGSIVQHRKNIEYAHEAVSSTYFAMTSFILQLRVYAIYEKSRKILILLLSMCAVEMAAMASLIGITISKIERLPVVSTPTGCSYTGLLPLSSLFWTPALIFEPILCGLVLVKIWRDLFSESVRGRPGYLPTVLARDSLIYFTVIFAELLSCTIIWAHFPHYINIIMPWSAALPSLLGSRLLLNLRQQVLRSEVYSESDICVDSNIDSQWHEA